MTKTGTINLLLAEQERLSAENRRLSAELAKAKQVQAGELPGPTRTHIHRIEDERDTALAVVARQRLALAGMQEVINRSSRPLWRHFWEELRASLVRVPADGGGK